MESKAIKTIEIKTENYHVWYELNETKVNFKGSLRLSGMEEYTPIVELLNEVVEQKPSLVNLDLKMLDFLNSSGISMLSKFVINVRKQQTIQIIIKGSKSIPWQEKSLKNLQRLMPSLTLELE